MSVAIQDAPAADTSSRMGPGLLVAGAGILLYRTIALLVGGAGTVLKRWVVGLTLAEMLVDLVTIAKSACWWLTRDQRHARLAMGAGAAATVLHAARVAVFVLGRTGPWTDFDVRPDKRTDHSERWTWAQVVFAGVLSVIGVIVMWRPISGLADRKRPSRPRGGHRPKPSRHLSER